MIEVVTGPMYAEKTTETIRRLVRSTYARKKVIAFRPKTDTRWGATSEIKSHGGISFPATVVASSADIERCVGPDVSVVALDEVQFFDPGIVPVAVSLANRGVRVIASGLDMDFKGEPFGCMPHLLAVADRVDKVSAVCSACGCEGASFTQRLVDGAPAKRDDPLVLIGAEECYEARCRKCHAVG